MAIQIAVTQPFTNVVASGLAVCDLRSLFGYTIQRIILQLGGGALTKAMLTLIQVKANGKVIVDTTGTRLDNRQTYKGITANAAFLTIDFLELRARSKIGLDGGGLDTTIGIKDLRVEVTITGATTPSLNAYAELSTPQTGPDMVNFRPLVARSHNAAQTIGAAGTFPLTVPHLDPNSGGSIFKRIHIFSANTTGARVERNGIREWEVNSVAANSYNQTEYARAPVASVFTLDFMVDGLLESNVLDTRPASGTTTANVFATLSGSETITVEVETLEPISVY